MARSKGAATAPVLTGTAASPQPSVASGMDMILRPPVMQEYRLGPKKIDLPKPITGSESTAKMSLIFYLTTSSLGSEAADVAVNLQLKALGTVMGQQTLVKNCVDTVCYTLKKRLMDPLCYTVKSYHKSDGTLVPSASYETSDPIILKTPGNPTTGLNATDRRIEDIAFVNVTVKCNLRPVLRKDVFVEFDTFRTD